MDTEIGIGYNSAEAVIIVTAVALMTAMLAEAFIPRRQLAGSLVWRWFNNFSLGAISWWLGNLVTAYLVFQAGRWVQLNNVGLFQQFAAPGWLVFAVALPVTQLLVYALHVAFHKIAWLWPLHAVHHLDTDVDVSTSYRNHPLETIIMLPLVLPVVLLLGVPADAALAVQLFAIVINVFSHSNVYLPNWLDRSLRRVIVTPDFHRLHHCADQRYTDSNYGGAVPWFDYLFGTASKRPFDEHPEMTLGLEYLREPVDSRIDRLLWLPFAWRRKNLRQVTVPE